MAESDLFWPALPLNAWQDTYLTLQLWTQVVGKIRMALSPPLNHWWHATLYGNARGLTTSPIPYNRGICKSYDPEYAHRLWRVPISTQTVMQEFRGRLIGKQSPVHFFRGSFDLAPVAGFTGRANYAYAVPKPEGLEREAVRPARAAWNPQVGEFILMYDDVRTAPSTHERTAGISGEHIPSRRAAGRLGPRHSGAY